MYPIRVKGKDIPQNRWDSDIGQPAGVMWNRVAQERNECKRLEGNRRTHIRRHISVRKLRDRRFARLVKYSSSCDSGGR